MKVSLQNISLRTIQIGPQDFIPSQKLVLPVSLQSDLCNGALPICCGCIEMVFASGSKDGSFQGKQLGTWEGRDCKPETLDRAWHWKKNQSARTEIFCTPTPGI